MLVLRAGMTSLSSFCMGSTIVRGDGRRGGERRGGRRGEERRGEGGEERRGEERRGEEERRGRRGEQIEGKGQSRSSKFGLRVWKPPKRNPKLELHSPAPCWDVGSACPACEVVGSLNAFREALDKVRPEFLGLPLHPGTSGAITPLTVKSVLLLHKTAQGLLSSSYFGFLGRRSMRTFYHDVNSHLAEVAVAGSAIATACVFASWLMPHEVDFPFPHGKMQVGFCLGCTGREQLESCGKSG